MMNDIRLEQRLRQQLTFPGLPNPKFAVVAPIVLGGEEPELLAEVRARGISQSGDPCFPGGKIEPGETPEQAALREMYEELGITADPARVLGQLPTVQTMLGRQSDIFVCLIDRQQADAVRPNPSEVSHVLRAPLQFFLERPHADTYPVDGHIIWGMTAWAIRNLCAAL